MGKRESEKGPFKSSLKEDFKSSLKDHFKDILKAHLNALSKTSFHLPSFKDRDIGSCLRIKDVYNNKAPTIVINPIALDNFLIAFIICNNSFSFFKGRRCTFVLILHAVL